MSNQKEQTAMLINKHSITLAEYTALYSRCKELETALEKSLRYLHEWNDCFGNHQSRKAIQEIKELLNSPKP